LAGALVGCATRQRTEKACAGTLAPIGRKGSTANRSHAICARAVAAAFDFAARKRHELVYFRKRRRGPVMQRAKPAIIAVAAVLAASLWLVAGGGVAVAQSVPASGRYQCAGASGGMTDLDFTVGPGNIYTTTKGFRGTMSVHPGTGNVLFHGAPPQASYQGRYSTGPPPQVALLTVTGGVSSEAGIVCQMR
jgi:hypothetical protein